MNDWTIMVYISADDVLANFAVESLKQLKRAAGKGIVAVAQFDANRQRNARQFAFDGSGRESSSIETDKVGSIPGPVNMTAAKTLTKFVNFATKKYPAKHYGLMLWGHGPELLFDDEVPRKTAASSRRYFTANSLRLALEKTKLVQNQSRKFGPRLDIIGIDACSMSLVEVASELEGCASYLIASQDEVPDASFPYDQLINRSRPLAGNAAGISRIVPKVYKEAFQNYIATLANGQRGITLSSLNLKKIGTIKAPLRQLASALLKSSTDQVLRKQILHARSRSHDFEFGLFVDLFDFCKQLHSARHGNRELKVACENVRDAIEGPKSKCVIANQKNGKNSDRCHGLSIYFPYRNSNPTEDAEIFRKNGTNHPSKSRINRILDLEEDFGALKTFGKTRWREFIQHGWSLILAKEVPNQLDEHYSAQQCAQNLMLGRAKRKPRKQGVPPNRIGKAGRIHVLPQRGDERRAG